MIINPIRAEPGQKPEDRGRTSLGTAPLLPGADSVTTQVERFRRK